MARRRGNKIPVHVTIGSNLKYGFQTQATTHAEVKAAFGQTQYAGAAGVFFGANAPKPPIATILRSTGNTSSFCSSAKVNDLKKSRDQYRVNSNTRRRAIGASAKTTAVYVAMPGGYKYGWRLTNAEVAEAVADLGVVIATAGDIDEMVWGSTPKPPRALKETPAGIISTFCKPQGSVIEAAGAKGWSISGVDYDLIPNA